MDGKREELQLVDGVRQTLAALRTRAEMLPEESRVRVDVEAYLSVAEPLVEEEVAALRRSVENEYFG